MQLQHTPFDAMVVRRDLLERRALGGGVRFLMTTTRSLSPSSQTIAGQAPRRPLPPRSRGSSRSRTASPNMLSP